MISWPRMVIDEAGARIEEAAGAGAEYAVKGIHNDLQRLRAACYPAAWRRPARARFARRSPAGSVSLARTGRQESPLCCARYPAAPFLRPADRINQKSADNRGVQALIVKHQHRVIQPGPGIHHIAAGTGLRRHLAGFGATKPARCIRGK